MDGQPRTLASEAKCWRNSSAIGFGSSAGGPIRSCARRSGAAHILEGQLIAISSLDEVIAICRQSPSRAVAKERLQNLEVAAAVLKRALGDEHFIALQREIGTHDTYHMTEAQADAVVRLQLGQLAALERDEIVKEYNELREQIIGYELLLSSEANIRLSIKKDLQQIARQVRRRPQDRIIGPPIGDMRDWKT